MPLGSLREWNLIFVPSIELPKTPWTSLYLAKTNTQGDDTDTKGILPKSDLKFVICRE